MKEPLVRMLAVIGAVYNGVDTICSLSRPPGLYARRHEISNLHVFSVPCDRAVATEASLLEGGC
jgi:hypothetical protein